MSEPNSDLDEFAQIAALFRPLTRGAPEAFGLLDDAAAIASRPGYDLVVTKDAMVAGVHFEVGAPPDLVAKRLMRANLSDLAAKGAEPYGYLLMTAWPADFNLAARRAFARGLDEDGQEFGVVLLGGDTVSMPGPLTLSMTMFGWVPSGKMIPRSGARLGDLLAVSGPIGDGWLDWAPGRGLTDRRWLTQPFRLAQPRLDLRHGLRRHATASADVSDGLIADAAHIAKASGLGLDIDLDRLPLSDAAQAWLATQDDRADGLLTLACGGDDYEIVCTVAPESATSLGLPVLGEVTDSGLVVRTGSRRLEPGQGGWRHR